MVSGGLCACVCVLVNLVCGRSVLPFFMAGATGSSCIALVEGTDKTTGTGIDELVLGAVFSHALAARLVLSVPPG